MSSLAMPSIDTLLPHRPPMLLLDGVEQWDAESLVARVEIRYGIPFFAPGRGVPAHIGIEYMAQACGAFAGTEALGSGQPIRLAYLLGTRHFVSQVPWFIEGQVLRIAVALLTREPPMGVFDCRILEGERKIAAAQLTVYRPEDGSAPREQSD